MCYGQDSSMKDNPFALDDERALNKIALLQEIFER